MIHDARIAAICLAHGVQEFWSADRDFSRFPDLNVVNPLVDLKRLFPLSNRTRREISSWRSPANNQM